MMMKCRNRSALELIVILMISVLLFVQKAESDQVVSKEAAGSVTAKDVLFCTSFIDHKDGETCFSITQKFNLTMDEFSDFNPNLNCDKLFVGEWLCLLADRGH